MSDATIALKDGVPATPLGAARNVLAVWLASAPVRVPVDVTGEPETVKIFGRARPTLVTPEAAGVSHEARPVASEVKTLPAPGVPPVIFTVPATTSFAAEASVVPMPTLPFFKILTASESSGLNA